MSATAPEDRRAQALLLLENPDDYQIADFIAVLQETDDLYYNDEESYLEDPEYDALRLLAERLNPAHVYFTGVGSDVRGGKVKLPFEMGSLDQIEIGDIAEWISSWNLQNEELVLSDKMDGTSALVIYNESGKPQIAYSRGNGTEGADISRHIFQFANVPSQISGPMTLRAEVELTQTAFETLRAAGIVSRSGKPYKNARNMVAGLMNSKTNPAIVYDHLTLVTYQVLGREDLSKVAQFDLLEAEGFQTANYTVLKGRDINDDMLASFLNMRRSVLDYEIDGIVIDVNDVKKRAAMNPTRDTLNPAYSIKYKVADASNVAVATVKGVTWNVSKHGYLKPQVNIEPVDLVGVTIQNLTGFNAKFIYDNKIGPGAKIRITRSGDVIPTILGTVEPTKAQMPSEAWEWNETEVDALIVEHSEEVAIQQVVDFFTSIDVPNLKEGSVRAMFEQNKYTDASHGILSMLNYDQSHWVSCIGANGNKIFNGLRDKMENIELYILAGSTHFFGRGIGKRKFKKLFAGLQVRSIEELSLINKAQITSVEGFEDKTATKIMRGMCDFLTFADGINNLTIAQTAVASEGGAMDGEKVCMTGFRNKALQARVEAEGGTVQSSVSSKTTIVVAKNPNGTSGKLKKARDLGIKIVGIEEFEEMLG